MAYLDSFIVFNLTLLFICLLQPVDSIIHLPLYRRGGRFSSHESANLTHLSSILEAAEAKYGRSYRAIEGNRLVRRWHASSFEDENDPEVVDVVGGVNRWYTTVEVGAPRQILEVDIDMLRPDFYTITTASDSGVKYNASASQSHGIRHGRAHPICARASDEFHLSPNLPALRLEFPACAPAKASRQSLAHSGTFLGLAPHVGSLARLSSPPLLTQLREQDAVPNKVWSVTLLDTETGILTLGGTIAKEVEEAKIRGDVELKHFGQAGITAEWVSEQVQAQLQAMMPTEVPWDQHFKWTEVQGAAGWWMALMRGVWIHGAKILRNQPVILDINVPFILAPPIATQRFYDSIGGTKRLPAPFDVFFAFPCFNQVNIALEIAGMNIPAMQGQGTWEDGLHGPTGGRFSLGKLQDGSGYCVGSVVETRMGQRRDGFESGMKDVWVLGEPFFRGLGVTFDMDKERVGVRVY
ncbi:hypothetical protein AYO21_10167 [Fonsecaea monophora]|uniref:Peptidase A1 domain-containing protein n=1 Tax=Fonsecaea monophora TaxID=254056 RepID=A0A177EUE9_9EURO|nr:hypothetical protein AYO21_10167 [Fonsecaea monophora]KAH0829859.1 hypothetical protein FOPE_10340 [Fonsecaea pedrosoi]OAG35627.1 hypothetical protein AYO21_10167 [Fonsecaea monophora]